MTEAYDPENLFVKIIRGEIPSHKVYEDGKHLRFHGYHAARRRPCAGNS